MKISPASSGAMRLHRASGCGLAFCLIIATVHHFQLFGTSHRLALKSSPPFRGPDAKATLSQLGQDDDWHVGSWSQQHLKAVSAGEVGPTTVKNIWRSKDQAWKGIDDILPTGGGEHPSQRVNLARIRLTAVIQDSTTKSTMS